MAKKAKDDKPAALLTTPVSFRLTAADHAAYLAKVKASRLNKSEFFRDCVLTNRTQVLARPRASVDKQRLTYLFNKTSNNINQLAYRANADHLEGKADHATYQAILKQLDAITAYMKATLDHVD